jgi:membrane associated rhomboid family serine protease
MIPLADENPPRGKPYVVYTLIAINLIVYIYQLAGGNIDNLSMIPFSVLHNERVQPLMNKFGQFVAYRPLPGVGPHPQWLTIFTSMFMHAGLLHIAGNMLYLWIFGNNIEDALGHLKFLLFYLGCGVLAAFAHIILNVSSIIPTVGASGAIAGVLGSYLFLYPGNRVHTLVLLGFIWTTWEIPAVLVLGVWFLTQLLGLGSSGGQIGGGVAYGAHIGGFVAGLVLILLLGGRSLRRPRARYSRRLDRYGGRGW